MMGDSVSTTGELLGTVLAVQANFYRVQLDQGVRSQESGVRSQEIKESGDQGVTSHQSPVTSPQSPVPSP
ncbi:ribosome small subunit-dependent GTPase, partial [Sphaerospermopsis sp. LEGE 08334]|nr:ribosome small subunit-dependent GTPase [Sphaerospermopsis sp. LEGE 08334]